MKKIILVVAILATALVLVGCKDKNKLDTKAEGEITVMIYNGDGKTYDDLGHQNFTVQEINDRKLGTMYAVAKEFNKIYPNIKINVHAKLGDSYDWATNQTWAQYRENFTSETGRKVDIWSVTDLAGDTTRGLVADLSVFKDDEAYKQLNPAIMNMLNYHGVQAGLPQYLVPWGVYINKSLAEQKNIDVPSEKWTIEEYVEFASNSKAREFYGVADAPRSFIWTGASTIAQQLAKQGVGQDFININSDEVRSLVPYLSQLAQHSVWDQYAAGNLEQDFFNKTWWTGMFKENKLLTHIGDPWSIGDLANPVTSELLKENIDWDYYPRPSTSKVSNTTGIVIDPIAVRNFAMDDNDAKLSDEEFQRLQIAYKFAAFWVGDTRSWQARSQQNYFNTNSNAEITTMDDGFPVTTGKAFDDQMDIWFQLPTHKYFESKEKTPGFHYILQLFKEGKIYDISDKAYPWNFDDAGSSKNIIHEWNQMTNPAQLTGIEGATSPMITDSAFTSTLLSKLPEWNTLFNQRFEQAFENLQASLIKYYQKTQKDFE